MKKLWNKISYRWFKFRFALRHARIQFILAYKDKVELTKDYLDVHGKDIRPYLFEHKFMVQWKHDTELKIEAERKLMAREGLDIEDFRSTK